MPTLSDALCVVAHIFNFDATGEMDIPEVMLIGLGVLMIKDVLDEFFPKCFSKIFDNYSIVRWGIYLALITLIMLIGVLDSGQFIYAYF